MKIEGVAIRVVSGKMMDEVFITCDNPYMNFCLHLPGEFAGKIKSGESLELIPGRSKAKAEVKPETK